MDKKVSEKNKKGITRRGFLQMMGAGAMASATTRGLSAEPAAEAAVKNAEPLEDNAYKVPLFRGIIEEELSAIAKV